jgi:hypothetical protein
MQVQAGANLTVLAPSGLPVYKRIIVSTKRQVIRFDLLPPSATLLEERFPLWQLVLVLVERHEGLFRESHS